MISDHNSNQQNVVHTSTSEDEEDRTQVSRSHTPRNLKHLYNPSDESYGSQSPLHINGIPSSGPVHRSSNHNRFPNVYSRQVNGGSKQ